MRVQKYTEIIVMKNFSVFSFCIEEKVRSILEELLEFFINLCNNLFPTYLKKYREIENGFVMLLFLMIFIGFVILWLGADKLKEGSIALTNALGISHRLIGLILIALATNGPKFFVIVSAALRNKPHMSIAGAVGANIFSTLALLGISSAIQPIPIDKKTITIDLPFMIVLSVLLPLLMLRGYLSQLDALFLV